MPGGPNRARRHPTRLGGRWRASAPRPRRPARGALWLHKCKCTATLPNLRKLTTLSSQEQWHIGKLGGAVVAVAKTMEFTVTNADGSEEVSLGLYPIFNSVRGELKTNRLYGLFYMGSIFSGPLTGVKIGCYPRCASAWVAWRWIRRTSGGASAARWWGWSCGRVCHLDEPKGY